MNLPTTLTHFDYSLPGMLQHPKKHFPYHKKVLLEPSNKKVKNEDDMLHCCNPHIQGFLKGEECCRSFCDF